MEVGDGTRLNRRDYASDAVTAAKALVGAWLCRRSDDGTVVRRRITETEAYCGEEDTACHAHRGRTARTDAMYRAGGCAYVYLCYGMHEMLNIVTGPEGRPEAVLIRAVEGAEGPGRLTKLLKIDRSFNRENLVSSDRLWLEKSALRFRFTSSPRIGISYAEERDRKRKWRFTIRAGSVFAKMLLTAAFSAALATGNFSRAASGTEALPPRSAELKNGSSYTIETLPGLLTAKVPPKVPVRFMLEENPTTGYMWRIEKNKSAKSMRLLVYTVGIQVNDRDWFRRIDGKNAR